MRSRTNDSQLGENVTTRVNRRRETLQQNDEWPRFKNAIGLLRQAWGTLCSVMVTRLHKDTHNPSFTIREKTATEQMGFPGVQHPGIGDQLQNSEVWSYVAKDFQFFTVIFPSGVAASRSPEKIFKIPGNH